MKLVELLAKELAEWPENVVVYFQWGNGEVFATSKGFPTEYNDGIWYVVGSDIEMAYNAPMYDKKLDLADDHDTANVNRAQWQAERDRQKGGEWKRHRGNSHPVDEGTWVEVKLRCGDIQQGFANAFLWRHADCDVAANIMKYRVISQPQAEEVEYRGPFPCAPIGEAVNAIEYDIEFPSGVFTLEAKTDQIDGPIKWRDTVNELDAHIEKFTRERDALIERLASEGFALIPAAVNANPDILPFKEWQVGDVVEVINDSEFCNAEIKVGDQLPIIRVDKSDDTVSVGVGTWSGTESYKFIRRP